MFDYKSFFVALLLPVQAFGLSCAAPLEPVDALNAARLAPDRVVVGYGTFADAPSQRLRLSEAHFAFSGVLFRDGAAVEVDPALHVRSKSCAPGVWCQQGPIRFAQDQPYLVVFGYDGDILHVDAGLCHSSIVVPMQGADVSRLARCLSSGTCRQGDFGLQ